MKTSILVSGLIVSTVTLVGQFFAISYWTKSEAKHKEELNTVKQGILFQRDLGDLPCGRKIEQQIPLLESIPPTVEISDIKSSCGCSVAKIVDDIYDETALGRYLSVEVTVPDSPGKFEASLLLLSKEGPLGTARIHGNAISSLMSFPRRLAMEDSEGYAVGRVRISHPGVSQTSVGSSHPQMSVNTSLSSVFECESTLIDVTIGGEPRGSATLEIQAGKETLKIPIHWAPRPNLVLHPNPLHITSLGEENRGVVTREVFVLYEGQGSALERLKIQNSRCLAVGPVKTLKDGVGVVSLTLDSKLVKKGERIKLATFSLDGRESLLKCEF